MYFCGIMRPNNNTLKPVLSEKFSGLVWKIKIHDSGIMAVETRNSDLKQVSFSALNFQIGKIYFKERVYDEAWNLNLAFTGFENLLLNGYDHAGTPESKGIISVSVQTGEILWQKFNISLNLVNDEGIQVYDTRFQPRKYSWIDHISGEALPNAVQDLSQNNSILFPETASTFEFPSFVGHGKLAGEVYALSYLGKDFLSFHEVHGNYLQQRLVVYQGDSVLIDDIIISGIQKLQPEAFFIQKNHLFYIRNKQEIITYLV